MTCVHLRELYQVCQNHDLKLTSSDLIRIVCPQCGVIETCPSVIAAEYESRPHAAEESPPPEPERAKL